MERSAGIAFGILFSLILALVLIRMGNSDKKARTQYDERQNEVRGRAYRWAFYAVMIYEAAAICLSAGFDSLPADPMLVHFGAVMAGCMVLASYCIWKDAYWGLNNNRKRYAVIFIVTSFINLIPVIGQWMGEGKLGSARINLMVFVMLVVIGIELLVKATVSKTEDEE